jgi:signal transduction histidine kinase
MNVPQRRLRCPVQADFDAPRMHQVMTNLLTNAVQHGVGQTPFDAPPITLGKARSRPAP